jgi:hypothetical protein
LLLEQHLDHRNDRVGQRQPHDAEQRAEQHLRAEHQCRRKVHRSLRDCRHDQVAVHRLDH